MKLIKYKDNYTNQFIWIWVRQDGEELSPFFNSAYEASSWALEWIKRYWSKVKR